MDFKAFALIAAVLLAATTIDQSQSSHFESFKMEHNKQYSEVEAIYRESIFRTNAAEVERHNADETQTYKKAVNKFSDLTQEEFEGIYLNKMIRFNDNESVDDFDFTGVSDVDWVSQGAVQYVKDQGQCGSCWAFSAAAVAESQRFLSLGTLGDFSEQQLTSCDTVYSSGCLGGIVQYALDYWGRNGICTQASYPYVSGNGSNPSCRQSSCTNDSYTINGYQAVASSTSALASACDLRPVSVALEARNWSSYSSGIFSNCGSAIDHGVLLAGYTSTYWLIKNSWGANWGESGYIRLAPGNTCNLVQQPCIVR